VLSALLSCTVSGDSFSRGDKIDELHGVAIFYNGDTGSTSGRNLSDDGYNLGLKYQCVEFVKRYYFERFNHRMKETYGHARDFYDSNVEDGQVNKDRGLIQFSNGSVSKPAVGDLIVFGSSPFNVYGHVAIVSSINKRTIEIAQQNAGYFSSRVSIPIVSVGEKWFVSDPRTLGWLRKE